MARQSSQVSANRADQEGAERLVSGHRQPRDDRDAALRPQSLDELIGQDHLKNNMKILVQAARQRSEPLDHVLLYGPPGLGKTTLSQILAREMDSRLTITSGPAIEHGGQLSAILVNLGHSDVLFIDEIHRLNRKVEETLYPAMEDRRLDYVVGEGPGARVVPLPLEHFTVIGATTRLASLTAPLRDRFGVLERFDFYSPEALSQIVLRAGGLMKLEVDQTGAMEIAIRARGTPRVALRLLRRTRDYAQVKGDGTVGRAIAQKALELQGIDHLGMDRTDRMLLHSLLDNFRGGPVGLETLASSISEEADTIMDVVEPFLMQLGFLKRTNRGRVATEQAYHHLGLDVPINGANQSGLFEG